MWIYFLPGLVSIGIIAYLATKLFYQSKTLNQMNQVLGQSKDLLLQEQQKQKTLSLELQQLREQFYQQVLQDPVTGLPGQEVFDDRLATMFNQSKRYQLLFGVLFLDIDGFKMINDALGYEVGDALLKEVAKRLQITLRKVDTVTRFASDSFVVLLPQIAKAESCAYISQRILDEISQPIVINNQEKLFITATIGIATYPADADDPKLLLKNASIALNQAKTRGNNTYQFFREEMQGSGRRELLLQSGLRNASVFHEFSLLYQPQVDTRNKKIICMEALLRWQHPDFGLVTPNEFIRLAEYSGKILEIGEWVLRTVCEQFQKWTKEDFHPGKVAVNLSWKQLENPHFIFRLSQILQETRMDPSCLVLDISEAVLLQKVELIEKALHMLKNLGVQVAIDDFGTGHLSLPRLQRFPINYLKIDGSLVQGLSKDPESEVIPTMIIALAKSLRVEAFAEEVETRFQKETLERLGCYVMQGHLFSLPHKAEEFTKAVQQQICAGI